MFDNIESLTAPSVVLKGAGEKQTTFHFEKMTALKAWPVVLEIRAQIGEVLDEDTYQAIVGDTRRPEQSTRARYEQVVGAILKTIMTLPTTFIVQLQNQMFQHVFYANASTNNTKQLLYQVEDAAFDGLDAFCVGEVLVRSLAVNFTSSFQRITDLVSDPTPPSTSPSPPDE